MELLLTELTIKSDANPKDLSVFAEALNTIVEQRIGKGIQIKHLSKHLCTSDRNLRRRCQKLFGITPSKLITRLRIEKAKRLLSQGILVGDIAHDLGFSSSSHFSRVFKGELGVSPSEYNCHGNSK